MKSPAQISPPPRLSKNADYYHAGNHAPPATPQARHIVPGATTVMSALSGADNEAHRTERCCRRNLESTAEHPDSEGQRPDSGMRRDFPVVFSANRHQVRESMAGIRVPANKTQADQFRSRYPGSVRTRHETVRRR